MMTTRHDSQGKYAPTERLESRVLLSNWYVSSTGNDNGPGTLAAPFKTIQHAANLVQPGDTVFIRAGTYREKVAPARSGTAAKPITFEAYNNESVTISGAQVVSNWSLYKGSIYDASVPWDLGNGQNQVFVDGVMINEARYPNTGTDLSHPTLATGKTITTSTSNGVSYATVQDPGLNQPANSWVGATMHILGGLAWYTQTGTITASSPGQVTFSYLPQNPLQTPASGNKYYISGKFQALDSAGEWYRDPTTGIMYIWMPKGDTSPTGHTIEVKQRFRAIELSAKSYITVNDISIFGARITMDTTSNHNTLDDINAKYISQYSINPKGHVDDPSASGIMLNGSDNILENSAIAFSAGNGVWMGGVRETVYNCVIHDTGYFGDDTAAISAARFSVTQPTTDLMIDYNTVYNAGRGGIVFSFALRVKVLHNVVHDCMLQTTDGGCIYTFGTDGTGSEIGYNICYNARCGGYGAAGIFLDCLNDHTVDNYLIDHNVIWNCDHGFKVNPTASNDMIINNTFAYNTDSMITSHDKDLTGSVFANNIFTGGTAHVVGALFENNLMYAPLTWSDSTFKNNIMATTDFGFVNTGLNDYQLASNSLAINHALIWSPYTDGYTGVAPDIGAFESGKTPFTAGSTLIAPLPFI
jgi:Right handed beta helix region/Protein of unknown function (DUF1565)